jgi:hypothetical protein
MRRDFLLATTLLALILVPAFEARADTVLTEDQVKNTCGKDLKTGDGTMGCDKRCGGGNHLCYYGCEQGKCRGWLVGLIRDPNASPILPQLGSVQAQVLQDSGAPPSLSSFSGGATVAVKPKFGATGP